MMPRHACCVIAAILLHFAAAVSSAAKPNIVFVLADDLGWAELGCYGNTFNETPHLDQLAKDGVRYTNAYAAAPVCSPFRASFMTGQWPARVGITDYLRPNDAKHLSPDHITIAEMLKQAGYHTGMIGKWHLTGYKNHGAREVPPAAHGFDETIISENRGIAGGSYFHPYHFNREIKKRLDGPDGKEYLVDRCNVEAVDFIERNKDKPFFLYLSHYAVHTRLVGRPNMLAKYSQKKNAGLDTRSTRNNIHLASQLEAIDEGVGMIRDKLKQLGLADNTIVIFMSDNGGETRVTSNAPLRAGKSTLYEGGIREPLIVHWPGTCDAGGVCDEPLSSVDFYPTLAAMAGATIDPRQHIDGVSFLDTVKNAKAVLPVRALYWHYPLSRPHFLGGRTGSAIRQGDWKLIERFDTNTIELYNLAADLSETKNVAQENAVVAERLHEQLKAWRKQVGAVITRHAPPNTKPKNSNKPQAESDLPTVQMKLAGQNRTMLDHGTKLQRGSQGARFFDGNSAYLDLPRDVAPSVRGRTITITAVVDPSSPDGVILAHGGNRCGYALYVKDSRLAFAACVDWKRTVVRTKQVISNTTVSRHTVKAVFTSKGEIELFVGGNPVAKGKAPSGLKSDPGDSLQIGADTIKPVGDYPPKNLFAGTIYDVQLDVK